MNNTRQGRRYHVWLTLCAAAISVLALAANPAPAQCQYEVTAIIEGPPCPPLNFPTPLVGTGMNELGHVTGWFYDCFQSAYDHGFFWTPETGRVNMHKPPAVWRVRPTGINDAGLIVGWMEITGVGQRGFVYDMHSQQYLARLEPLHGVGDTSLNAINNAGIAVGSRVISKPGVSPRVSNAVIWDTNTGKVIDLGVGDGPNSGAMDISESGEFVVGWANGSGFLFGQAVIWTNEKPQVIGLLPGTDYSIVNAVNESGVAVGYGRVDGAPISRTFIWDGTFTIIDAMDGWNSARGTAINDLGQAFLRFSNPSPNVAMLWQRGKLHHLNALLIEGSPDVHVTGVTATNNYGQVLCTEGTRAVLLTPADRPLTDLNADCRTDVDDLLMLLDAWSSHTKRSADAPADFNADGVVDVSDLLILLANWGQ